jgi:hypothetical protein
MKERQEEIDRAEKLSKEIDKLLEAHGRHIGGDALARSCGRMLAQGDRAEQGGEYDAFGSLVAGYLKKFNRESGKNIMKGEEFKVVLDDNVREEVANDPVLAAALNEATSRMRAALDGIDCRDREAVEKAMRSIGAELVDENEAERVNAKVEAVIKAKKTMIN